MTSRRETSCRAGSSLPQPFFQEKRKIINGRRQTLRMLSILRMRSTADGRHNAAFTLLELLVVIAIIVILIGLLSVGLMGARRQALYKATKGRIAQLELAVQSFYDEFRVYPPDEWGDNTTPADGTMMQFLVNQGYDTDGDSDLDPEITTAPNDTYQDIECLVYAVTVVRPFLQLKMAERSNREATPDNIEWPDATTMTSPAYEICDAWGTPLHYSMDSSGVRDDGTDDLTHNPGFVEIWSSGPDRDSSADGSGSPEDADNITNWERD